MSTPSEKGDTTHGGNNPHGSNHHEGDIIGRRGSVVREDIETETEKRIASIMENNSSSVFANVTLCLMGMSSVLLYNCVLNTTPHIHELLNKNIIVSTTFFLYFSVLVFISLISSLFIEVKTVTYDFCFILSFILQFVYPFVVKYYHSNTLFFYILIGLIGATCSLMKTMIFSIATIVLSSSKVICLSYGLTGIYSLLITSTFFYFLIKIEKDIKKLIQSIFVTSCINCTFILTSFICYTLLKRTDDFKRKFKMYTEQRREKKDQKGEKGEKKQSQYVQHNTHDITIGITPTEKKEDTHCVFISIENTQNECQTIDPTHTLLSTMRDKVTLKKKDNLSTDVIHDNTDNNNAVMKNTCGQSTMEIDLLCGERISTGVTTQKQHFIKRFYKFNENRENLARQTRVKLFLYKKSFIFLFCTFYNIFLKIAVFPVVCPEMWTKNVDERYILIGMVQLADCISRIFPTFAETVKIFHYFLLPQKKVLIYSLGRTLLSLLCLLIPLIQVSLLQNFIFKCILIFSNIYLNGWFVTLSFINIADVLKPLNTMSNVAIVSSFGSTLLRVGLLTGYGVSTIYKHIVGKI
ncbi:nucleoside transporter 2, putative [Plasmodium ovale]|uniref:Nucleoside transporter 2, putative n=1 Tax=Plasmodium ovale TaxID=36330 RepID=A0A1D3KXS2_PLAOA|nr:nucleoside transporter 2, putative [Plasmodium ovale]